ncbi:cell division protein ZapA [Basilea psittacipulmonis]|uniref:Cell division protein ZapA n=1 Tax=Basilea psittacipulmonis DSM 24701 TaxID=1072685 RepID=A0A077DIQ9_9BURK|nr:cell division protein ZapA [Basilea psittacipulmonis]AIL33357.1 hypothetical protein IX83_08635 [Basilea psittacipulmonis DSM 24701]
MSKITVNILGRDINLACQPQESEKIRSAAEYAGQLMDRIRKKSTNLSSEQVAILACIQLATELQNVKAQDGPLAGVSYGKLQETLADINDLLNKELKTNP